jgi:hypothetical protein
MPFVIILHYPLRALHCIPYACNSHLMHHHVRRLSLRALSSSSRSYLSFATSTCATTTTTHTSSLSAVARAPSTHEHVHRRRQCRHYATRAPFGLVPRHVVEKARRALPPSAVPIRAREDPSAPPTPSPADEVGGPVLGVSGGTMTARDEDEERAAAKRRRRTEWKRRQGVSCYFCVCCTMSSHRLRRWRVSMLMSAYFVERELFRQRHHTRPWRYVVIIIFSSVRMCYSKVRYRRRSCKTKNTKHLPICAH